MTNINGNVIFTHIAGITKGNGQHLARKLKVGDMLDLVREPENGYDSCAIAVYSSGQHLGYVPREENWKFCHRMDRGDTYECTVTDIEHTVGKRIITTGVKIRIECIAIKNIYEERYQDLCREVSIAIEKFKLEYPSDNKMTPPVDLLEVIELENRYEELYESGKILSTLKRRGKQIELKFNDETDKKTQMMMLSFITKLAKLNRVINSELDQAISDSYNDDIDFSSVMMTLDMVNNREEADFICSILKEKATQIE